MTALEAVAAAMGVAMVLLNMRVHPAAWPLAIGSSAVYLFVFWEHRLYGDATLQLLFIAMAAWGWWQWLRGTGNDGAPLVVRSHSLEQALDRGLFGVVDAHGYADAAGGRDELGGLLDRLGAFRVHRTLAAAAPGAVHGHAGFAECARDAPAGPARGVAMSCDGGMRGPATIGCGGAARHA